MPGRKRKSKRTKSPQTRDDSTKNRRRRRPTAEPNGRNRWLILGFVIAIAGLATSQFGRTNPESSAPLEKRPRSVTQKLAFADGGSPPIPAKLTTASLQADQARTQNQLDPQQDGWQTEALAAQAKKQLLHLAQRLAGHDLAEHLAVEVSPHVTCGPLRPANLTSIVNDTLLGTEVAVKRADVDDDSSPTHQGLAGLEEALTQLAEPLAAATKVHVHIKVIRVEAATGTAQTTAYFESGGTLPGGSFQQRATWDCEWEQTPAGQLQLTSIHSSDYEEVSVSGDWLVDCTQSVLQDNRSFREQLAFGHHDWLSRLNRAHGITVFTRSGMALGDVNGDGLDDVYVCQPGGLPNRLYRQQPDGTASDSSNESGVDWLDHTSSALIVDLDNDGDQDLVVATTAGLLLMSNDGTGRFQLQSTLVNQDTDTHSLSAVDYDQDGDLDVYVCIEFANRQPGDGERFVYHDANDGAANRLFRNNSTTEGDWQFEDVTEQVGLDTDNRRHSLACAWEDYDNDGDQDLYVANDYGPNCLYRNDDGQFTNVAEEANAVDSASGMSVSWGDYNRDGWMDLYVANMFSSAGNRITRQAQFMPDADDETRALYSRFAKGNTLLENDGRGHFREVDTAGIEMGRWAWSSLFADMNNDAWDDLLVANGYMTTEDTGDL